jgi:putative DNA-invertase from lambdoid prophage Rac
MAENDPFRPCSGALEKCLQNRLQKTPFRIGFWPALPSAKPSGARRLVCACLNARPTDVVIAAASHARLCHPRGWTIAVEIKEVGSGASVRELRQKLLEAARRRDIDVVVVWRLDRWGRSMADLVTTLQELRDLGVGFVSLTEALDLTTPTGRAMAGLLAVFAEFEREILQERAGLAHAREKGKRRGRPPTAVLNAKRIRQLFRAGTSKSAIARQLQIGRTSVRRILAVRSSA